MTRTAVLALLLLAASGAAQEPISREARQKALREGTHIFRRVLHDAGFTALELFEDLKSEPSKTVLIVLGNLDVLEDVPGGLAHFLAEGGSVLIASDRLTRNERVRREIIRVAGVSISGDPIICPWECYSQRDYCPVLKAGSGSQPNLLEGLAHVATNVPSMLRIRGLPRGITPLLFLPNRSQIDVGDFRPTLADWPLFGVGGPSGRGRILMLADHSVFINEMMFPSDTGNFEFASNVIAYLRDDTRDRVLFLDEDGRQTKLDLPLKSANLSIEEVLSFLYSRRNQLLQQGEKWLAKAEEDNLLEKKLVQELDRRGLGMERILFGALIVATLLGTMLVAYRMGLGERYAPARHPPLIETAGRALPAGPLTEQRLDAMVIAHDVREPLGELARRWLRGLGIAPEKPMPQLVTRGWWSGWALRSRLRRLHQLAARTWPKPIAPARLVWWQRELDELRAAHERGEWHVRGNG